MIWLNLKIVKIVNCTFITEVISTLVIYNQLQEIEHSVCVCVFSFVIFLINLMMAYQAETCWTDTRLKYLLRWTECFYILLSRANEDESF